MERFHLHTTCGSDPAIWARVDPATTDRATVLKTLKRALVNRHGPVAKDMEIQGFTWCRDLV